jgi:hypothetical protein
VLVGAKERQGLRSIGRRLCRVSGIGQDTARTKICGSSSSTARRAIATLPAYRPEQGSEVECLSSQPYPPMRQRLAMTMAHRDVVAVLGPADEALIAEIIATDATAEELSQPGLGETATRR